VTQGRGQPDGENGSEPQGSGFDQRLKDARNRQGLDLVPQARDAGWGLGMRAGTEAAAAIGIGVLIGVLLDRWLGTGPILLLVFLAFGCAAALRNLMALLRRTQQDQSAGPPGPE